MVYSWGQFAGLAVWTLASAGAVIAGLRLLRHPASAEALRSYFHRAGSSLFGQRMADRTYTANGVRVAAWGWLILGSLFVVIWVSILAESAVALIG